jgi:hypothetical protein
MKIILSRQIDYLNFKNEDTIRSTQIICATHSTIVQFYYIYTTTTTTTTNNNNIYIYL